MNAAWSQRVSLISALGLPTILSPTIGATTGDRPAARRFGSRLSPALQASSFARRLAHPHRPNRVHGGCPRRQPVLRTGRSRSVALHPALLRRSYGSIPHGSSPHRSGLPPLYPIALSGARAPVSKPACRELAPAKDTSDEGGRSGRARMLNPPFGRLYGRIRGADWSLRRSAERGSVITVRNPALSWLNTRPSTGGVIHLRSLPASPLSYYEQDHITPAVRKSWKCCIREQPVWSASSEIHATA